MSIQNIGYYFPSICEPIACKDQGDLLFGNISSDDCAMRINYFFTLPTSRESFSFAASK